MNDDMNKRYYLNSIGPMYKKSLMLFAEKIEDHHGNALEVDHIDPDDGFFVIFKSGTGFTRTSGRRIV